MRFSCGCGRIMSRSCGAFVRSCCPRAQEVDEVMQDVSIAAWRKFSSLEDHDAFGAWACMIARYELLMTRRRFRAGPTRFVGRHCEITGGRGS